MKLSFRNIEDHFPKFGIRISIDNIKNENIIENKIKVVHHDHAFEKDNILTFICRECNLQIKNDKSIPIYFFNGMKYDNSILLKSLCDIYKDEMTLNCISNSSESFKMIDFKFKNMKYSFKLLDICNFVEGNLLDLYTNKYTTSCSLTLDLMLKYTKAKIELFKDITMFDYVNSSILGGLCIASQNIVDNNDNKSTISSCDVCSLYPYIMTQKLPLSNYKFASKFYKNRYGQNKNHSCLLNVEIYTTKKVLNNKILSQFPALISKTKISYDQLSDFQRKKFKREL